VRRPSKRILVEEPKIGVVVLNYNGKEWLPALFNSLQRDTYPNKKIYLLDNCSTDGSVQFSLEHYPDISVIRMPRNAGYPAAYNVSMPKAFEEGCDYVIWSNNDVIVELGCLERLVRAGESDPLI